MSAMASQTPVTSLFAQLLVQVQIKEIIKAPQHWPFFPQKRPVTRKMFPFDDVIMWRALTCTAVPIFTNLMTFRTITCKSTRDVDTLSSATQARVGGTLVDVWNDQMGSSQYHILPDNLTAHKWGLSCINPSIWCCPVTGNVIYIPCRGFYQKLFMST